MCLAVLCCCPQGCHLGPGSYRHASAIDDLLAHSVSKRGPYDLFTGERDKAVKVCVRIYSCVFNEEWNKTQQTLSAFTHVRM